MTRIKSLVAKVAALSAVIGMVALVSPASAAPPTNLKDTLSREKISTSATHSLSMTLPAGGITTGNTLTVTYTGFGTDFAGTPTVTCGAGTATAGFATNVLTLTGGGTACTGTLTVTPYTGTNPGTAGSKTVTLAGSAGITGSFALSIVDDDSVTITATVDPSITFDLDNDATNTCGTTETPAAYTVALGTITTADGRVSGATDGVNNVCVDLNTNASVGAVVTVVSLNGSSGLKSTSTPADTIPSATTTQSNGTANYGICVVSTSAGTGTFNKVSPFNGSCAANTETNAVGGLTTSAQAILNSNSLPIATGRAQIAVNAAISGVTPAHSDYTDTLTFIATGTF